MMQIKTKIHVSCTGSVLPILGPRRAADTVALLKRKLSCVQGRVGYVNVKKCKRGWLSLYGPTGISVDIVNSGYSFLKLILRSGLLHSTNLAREKRIKISFPKNNIPQP